ncbi:hypothetical protein SFRURICE_008090, partial [Spodoptera frugiperda]
MVPHLFFLDSPKMDRQFLSCLYYPKMDRLSLSFLDFPKMVHQFPSYHDFPRMVQFPHVYHDSPKTALLRVFLYFPRMVHSQSSYLYYPKTALGLAACLCCPKRDLPQILQILENYVDHDFPRMRSEHVCLAALITSPESSCGEERGEYRIHE